MKTALLLLLAITACGRTPLNPADKKMQEIDASQEVRIAVDAVPDSAIDVVSDAADGAPQDTQEAGTVLPDCVLDPMERMFSSVECPNLVCGVCMSVNEDGSITPVFGCYVANRARLCVRDCNECN